MMYFGEEQEMSHTLGYWRWEGNVKGCEVRKVSKGEILKHFGMKFLFYSMRRILNKELT